MGTKRTDKAKKKKIIRKFDITFSIEVEGVLASEGLEKASQEVEELVTTLWDLGVDSAPELKVSVYDTYEFSVSHVEDREVDDE